LGVLRRVLQTLAPAASAGVSQTDERWFLLAWQAAIADLYSYSKSFFRGFVKVFFNRFLEVSAKK
jgi:hypothetical protein